MTIGGNLAERDAPRERLFRATADISAWNLVSRVTGFGRVIAMGAALGVTALGDTYQSANLVSNILFELLAGGMLSSVLVPTFVDLLARDDRPVVARVAGAVTMRAAAVLGAIVVVGIVASPWIMRVLTLGVDDPARRDAQVRLGSFLLWFFLPQLVLYAVGAVTTALLNADRRFTAAAAAPVANNLVVIATMIVFRSLRDGDTALALSTGEKLVLGLGTSAGVLAMTVVPLWAARRARLAPRPRWDAPVPLTGLARRGLWAAGHVGLNQLLVAVTIVLAARVTGGVVAYQMAFTFFLLPHALLAQPVYTAWYPRLVEAARDPGHDEFAADLRTGLRTTSLLVLPASAVLVVVADPALRVLRFGALDAAGADLVASVLAAYALGLAGYSAFFFLTRASYALDDVASPTIVNLVATLAMAAGMAIASGLAQGDDRVWVLGWVHAAGVTVAAVALFANVRRRIAHAIEVAAMVGRDAGLAIAAGLAGWVAVDAFDGTGRGHAAVALVAGAATVVGLYGAAQLIWQRFSAERIHARGVDA